MRPIHTDRRACSLIMVLVSVAGAARAQNPSATMTFSIDWEKPSIAPGETNKATVWATLWPDIGATVTWHRSGTGTGVPGILKAFASAIFGFKNINNGLNGTIVSAAVPDEFANAPDPVTPDGNAGVIVKAAQLGPPANPSPNVAQSVAVLVFEWQAGNTGKPYDVLYAVKSTSGKVHLDVGLFAWVGENAIKFDGQGGFTVTPSPASVAVGVPLLMAGLGRRRKP